MTGDQLTGGEPLLKRGIGLGLGNGKGNGRSVVEFCTAIQQLHHPLAAISLTNATLSSFVADTKASCLQDRIIAQQLATVAASDRISLGKNLAFY